MPTQVLKTKTGAVAIATATIRQQERAAEIRACQQRYEAKILDYENEVAAKRNKMRGEYLAEMQLINGGGDEVEESNNDR